MLRLKKELEAVEAIKSYNFNRVKFLERQNNLNYKNEYDRLEGELSRGNITGYAKRNIEKRKEFLKKKYTMIFRTEIIIISSHNYIDGRNIRY